MCDIVMSIPRLEPLRYAQLRGLRQAWMDVDGHYWRGACGPDGQSIRRMSRLLPNQHQALQTLTRALAEARAVVLSGFQGTGKTEVSRELQASLGAKGRRVIELIATEDGAEGRLIEGWMNTFHA